MDLLYALAGFANVNNGPVWEASARRLIDILMEGLKAPRASPRLRRPGNAGGGGT